MSESGRSLPKRRRGFSPIWPTRRRSTAPRTTAWKEPLWHALAEAGLTLAWVPEEQGGAGAELADGFAVLGVAGRYAAAVPLAETLLAGWLLARAGLKAPQGAMSVAPARPGDKITLNADGTLSGRARARAVRQGGAASRGAGRIVGRAGRDRGVPPQRRDQPRRRAVQHRHASIA